MTKKLDTTFIQIVHPVCCGLDVHKKKISACLITVDNNGKEQYEIKEFGTFTDDLVQMKNWFYNQKTEKALSIKAYSIFLMLSLKLL